MAKSVMLVFSNPIDAAREAEFNKWYDQVHAPEVVALPGFTGATRYKLSDTQMGPVAGNHGYLAIYEIDGDPSKALAELGNGVKDGRINMANAPLQMDPPPSIVMFESTDA